MVEFYNKYFSPSSTSRARISVHMRAKKAGEMDRKVIDLLKQSGANEVPEEMRQSVPLLDAYLKKDAKLTGEEIGKIVAQVTEMGLSQAPPSDAVGGAGNDVSAVDSATEITDVQKYKAGLLASSGARPVKDVIEFAESDAKL